jgi:hypothetical protein
MEEIEKANARTETVAHLLIEQVASLISLFSSNSDEKEFKQVNQLFALARKVLPAIDLAHQISPYFIKFKDRVERSTPEDLDYMVNYDYTKLIVENCLESTADLIRSLTKNIKSMWVQDNKTVNDKILATTKKMVRLSSIFQDSAEIGDSKTL